MSVKPLATLGMLSLLLVSMPSSAASDAACAIWLCAPAGFPSGCSAAKKAMIKRIKKLKPPLPSFRSCMVKPDLSNDDGGFDASAGIAAYVPEREVCTAWGRGDAQDRIAYQTIAAHAVKHHECREKNEAGEMSIEGCQKSIHFVDIYQYGQPYGETYYFDLKGNTYKLP